MVLIHNSISKHLIKISKFLKAPPNNTKKPLTLDRKNTNDELQFVVNTLNNSRKKEKNKNNYLEKEIITRKKTEGKLLLKNSIINSLFDTMENYFFIIERDATINKTNQQATKEIKLKEEEIIGIKINEIIKIKILNNQKKYPIHVNVSQLLFDKTTNYWQGYCQFKDGSEFPAEITTYTLDIGDEHFGFALSVKDATEKKYIEGISYNATHDYLTGTYNRFYFDKKLEQTLLNKEAAQPSYSIGLLDLDSFKNINDLFGHSKGDEVLIHTTQVMLQHFGQDSIIARQGGDEFVFLLEMPQEQAYQVAQSMLATLRSSTFYHNQNSFHITASIGISEVKPGTDTVSTAIAKADQGCYKVKGNGGGNVAITQSKAVSEALEKKLSDFRIIDIFQQAIARDEIHIYAQEIIPLQKDSNLPSCIELLFRMHHEDEIFTPDQVLPALERSRMLHLLDGLVMDKLNLRIKNGSPIVENININLSPFSISNDKIKSHIESLIKIANQHDITITFEITERALMSHFELIKGASLFIKELGGKIAIDDFGKGQASYAYIEALNPDMIKIDGSLIERVGSDGKIRAIISSIQAIANSTGSITVAEHVLNEADKRILNEMGIDYIQSYLEGQPYPFDMS